jgi:hypothetical protein
MPRLSIVAGTRSSVGDGGRFDNQTALPSCNSLEFIEMVTTKATLCNTENFVHMPMPNSPQKVALKQQQVLLVFTHTHKQHHPFLACGAWSPLFNAFQVSRNDSCTTGLTSHWAGDTLERIETDNTTLATSFEGRWTNTPPLCSTSDSARGAESASAANLLLYCAPHIRCAEAYSH